MPTRMTRSLALASIAALPLALGTAWAQTESEPDAEDAAAETETLPAPASEGEGQPEPSMSTGPKRVKVPSSGDTAASDEDMQTEEADLEQPAAGEDEGAEMQAEGEAPEAGGDTAETAETGVGPFVGDYTLGNPDAPVQVVEYASFTCPHCAAYHQTAWDDLKADFIDPGRIGFTMREVYFDRFGLWASMAARCGGEKGYYPMADQFLSKQAEWTKAEDIAQAIADIARMNGLTETQIKACLENQDFAKMLVDEYKQTTQADEVSSTPTFLIISPDGTERVVGNKPDEVREAIEAALPAG